jgi:3-methylfumaryl-CoA hydratase
MSIDRDELRKWIGRSETRDDHVTVTPLAALAATLDRDDPVPQPGSPIPPLWHWLYFTPLARQREIGPDGHAERGGFLPPVDLPRRMWAGSRLTFHHSLRVGEATTRRSVIASVEAKEGRSGPLVFVTVRHHIADGLGEAITE